MNPDKRNKSPNSQLIKEYIDVLVEESANLFTTFIQPFADVKNTALYGAEKLTRQTLIAIKGLLLGFFTLFIPFLEFDYNQIAKQSKEELKALRDKYSETLNANLTAITSNDAFGIAFLLSPTAVLATQLAVRAPYTALRLFNNAVGGIPVLTAFNQQFGQVARIGIKDPGGHDPGAWAHAPGGGGYDGGMTGDYDGLYEAPSPAPTPTPDQPDPTTAKAVSLANQFLQNKKAMAAFQASPIAKQMRKDGVALFTNHIKKFLSLKDLNQMKAFTNGHEAFANIDQELAKLNSTGKLDKSQNDEAIQALTLQIKKQYKDFWVKKLQGLAEQFPESKIEFGEAIAELQSL